MVNKKMSDNQEMAMQLIISDLTKRELGYLVMRLEQGGNGQPTTDPTVVRDLLMVEDREGVKGIALSSAKQVAMLLHLV